MDTILIQPLIHLLYNFGDNLTKFDALGLESEEITTNYRSPSLIDFENSTVTINYDFAFPKLMKMGNITADRYVSDGNEIIPINFQSINFTHKNYIIEIKELKRIGPKSYEGYCNMKPK